MRAKSLVLLAAVSTLAFTCIASAADLPVKAPIAAAAPYNWTGYYVGGSVGYGWSNDAINITSDPQVDAFVGPGIDPTIAANANGLVGGLQAGYNYQTNRMLFGIETDVDWSGIRRNQNDTRDGTGAFAGHSFTTIGDQKLDFFGTLRGRVGWTSDNLLIYATGGLAYGHGSFSTVTGSPGGGGVFCGGGAYFDCTSGSSSKMLVGWTLGAGLEWNLVNNWSAKVEYLYYDFGNVSFSAPDVADPLNPYQSSLDFKGNIVRFGLNYRFKNF